MACRGWWPYLACVPSIPLSVGCCRQVEVMTPQEPHPGERVYLEVPSVVANLNEEGLNRHIMATINLAVNARNADEVWSLLDRRMAEVSDWLNIYLSGCMVEDVRGPENLRRIQREIADARNGRFWPKQKPRIEEVLLREWHVQ